MLTNALSFIARVGGIVLLIFFCRWQAQALLADAFAGDLPAMDWVILVYSILIGTGAAMALLLSAFMIILSLTCTAADTLKHYLNIILRDSAALRCGR